MNIQDRKSTECERKLWNRIAGRRGGAGESSKMRDYTCGLMGITRESGVTDTAGERGWRSTETATLHSCSGPWFFPISGAPVLHIPVNGTKVLELEDSYALRKQISILKHIHGLWPSQSSDLSECPFKHVRMWRVLLNSIFFFHFTLTSLCSTLLLCAILR